MSYPKLMKSRTTQAVYLVSSYGHAKCLDVGTNEYARVGRMTHDLRMHMMEDFEIPTEEVSDGKENV